MNTALHLLILSCTGVGFASGLLCGFTLGSHAGARAEVHSLAGALARRMRHLDAGPRR